MSHERIFVLPQRGALSQERAHWQELAARVLEATPDSWSDVSGVLEPSDQLSRVSKETGYAFHRFDQSVRVATRRDLRRLDRIVRPDPVSLLVSGVLPRFVPFDETGYGACWKFLIAKNLAAGFVRRGYLGWLSLNNGLKREYGHEKPAEVELRLTNWEQTVGQGSLRLPRPPAVLLRWDARHGGSPEHLDPFLHEETGGLPS